MKKSSVLTTSLPAELVGKLKKAEYTRSFIKAAANKEMQSLAEEGLADYLKILDE